MKKIKYYILRVYGYLIFGKFIGVHGFFRVGNKDNVIIGDGCGINSGVYILGRNKVIIGNDVILSVDSKLIDAGIDLEDFSEIKARHYKSASITIEDGVWVGAGAIVLSGVTLGKKCVVGAGSVVTRSVPPFTVVAGNPAKAIRKIVSNIYT